MPPTAPAIPPIPTTEPTARRGNMSDVSVNKLADQPWWAAAANPTRNTATQRWDVYEAKTIGTTHTAQMIIAVLRARLGVHPIFSKRDEIQPPPMLPTSARI